MLSFSTLSLSVSPYPTKMARSSKPIKKHQSFWVYPKKIKNGGKLAARNGRSFAQMEHPCQQMNTPVCGHLKRNGGSKTLKWASLKKRVKTPGSGVLPRPSRLKITVSSTH